jgi:hypothetical protein
MNTGFWAILEAQKRFLEAKTDKKSRISQLPLKNRIQYQCGFSRFRKIPKPPKRGAEDGIDG